jgi:hypothetical protein
MPPFAGAQAARVNQQLVDTDDSQESTRLRSHGEILLVLTAVWSLFNGLISALQPPDGVIYVPDGIQKVILLLLGSFSLADHKFKQNFS